jgi:hypothetical protein
MRNDAAGEFTAKFASDEPLAERLVHMVVAMATELAVTRERLMTLESMLGSAGVLGEDGVDGFVADEATEAARKQWREQFLDSVLEQLQGEITAAGVALGGDRTR